MGYCYWEHCYGCWCPGSLHRQVISSHDIDYVFVFLLKNLAGKELNKLCWKDASEVRNFFGLYFFCGWIVSVFATIIQAYITGIGAIIWFPLCQWGNPEGYG